MKRDKTGAGQTSVCLRSTDESQRVELSGLITVRARARARARVCVCVCVCARVCACACGCACGCLLFMNRVTICFYKNNFCAVSLVVVVVVVKQQQQQKG